MRLEGPIPDGGYGDVKLYQQIKGRLLLNRAPAQTFTPGEILTIIWDNLHPRLSSAGLAYSERTNQGRKDAHFCEMCTIWVADVRERHVCDQIPLNSVPYISIWTKEWSEEKTEWSESGEMVIGWRRALYNMMGQGFLCTNDDMDYLIGESTWNLIPASFRR